MEKKVIIKKTTTRKTYQYRIKKDMIALGVYKDAYRKTIELLADQLFLYDKFMGEFEESGYEIETPSAAGTAKKSPTVAMLELLWKNILNYSDRLCINPRALKEKDMENETESLLDKALSESE